MTTIRYDIEDMLDDIETMLKANLNAKITAIESSKAIASGIKTVAAGSYFQQNWNDKILNVDPAIFYGLEQIQATGSNSATVEIYKIFVEVVMLDTGQDDLAKRRIHRYARALKEVFQENFSDLPFGNKTNIETIRPISFKLDQDSSDEIKIGGVSITTTLA